MSDQVDIKCTPDNFKLVPINSIKPNPKNNNRHPIEQMEHLKKLLLGNGGFREPLTVSNQSGLLVCGHLRLEIAKELGMKELPVMFQDFASPAEEYQHMTADNEVARYAQLDYQNVYDALKEIPEINTELLGIENFVIPEVVEPQCDEDEVPEVPEEPKTKLGDIYKLGNHRLMCGDSTSIDAVEKLMDGHKADVTFTSPPYNANTKAGDGDIFTSKKSKKLYADGYSDNLESSSYVDFTKSVLNNCFLVTEGFIYWNVSYNANSRYEYIQQIIDHLPFLIEQICWKKTSTIPFKGSLMRDWEPVYLFSTHGHKLGLNEVTSNHWQISNTHSQQENHKACFPVELPEKGISLINSKTKIVFDPFGGSGSTLIACEKLSRNCFLMELDPSYCDVIVDRWEKFTGKKAELING